MSLRTLTLLVSLVAVLHSGHLPCQCGLTWSPGSGLAGASSAIYTGTMWDPDGPGPAAPRLVVGGTSRIVGEANAGGIASLDRATGRWHPFGAGVNNFVNALLPMPNGDLIAGGAFSAAGGLAAANVARWNGSAWSPIGSGLATQVSALARMPNGDIVAGGWFPGGVARWNGSTWQTVGGGMTATTSTMRVLALQVMANGDLIAGGWFSHAGGTAAAGIARWDGTSWSSMPGYTTVYVTGFAFAPNGNLLACGWFEQGATIDHVVEWNGTGWQAVGTITDAMPLDLAVLPSGEMFAACQALNGSNDTILHWDGVGWSLVGGGVSFATGPPPVGGAAGVLAVVAEPTGSVAVLGYFSHAGSLRCNHMARWNGAAWSPLATGTDDAIDRVLTTANGDVLAGGAFTAIEGTPAAHIARWNGATWSPLGAGTDGRVRAVVELPGGDVVAAGAFATAGGVPAANIARWNGTAWSPLGAGTDGEIRALAVLPGGDVVAGGGFTLAGGAPAANVARWNGTAWSPLGAGIGGSPVDGTLIEELLVLANGDLCAAGHFATAGGVVANGVARWNGAAWSGYGSGMTWSWLFGSSFPGRVYALLELPNGDLVAAGAFDRAGGLPITNVARWTGGAWQAMGGNPGYVNDLLPLPNGDVLAGGLELRRWSGTTWSPLGGTEPGVASIALRRSGELLLGGAFLVAEQAVSAFVARVATDCPASTTAYGAGCTGSAGPQQLATTAEPWLGGTFRARATGMPASSLALAVWGFGPINIGLPTILPQGVPGCALLANPDWWDVLVPAGAELATQLAVPDAAVLLGASAFHQVVPFELAASGIVAVTGTNGLQLAFGDL